MRCRAMIALLLAVSSSALLAVPTTLRAARTRPLLARVRFAASSWAEGDRKERIGEGPRGGGV